MRKLPLPSFALDNEKIGGVKYRRGEGFARFRFCMERWERPMESALTGEKRTFSKSMSCGAPLLGAGARARARGRPLEIRPRRAGAAEAGARPSHAHSGRSVCAGQTGLPARSRQSAGAGAASLEGVGSRKDELPGGDRPIPRQRPLYRRRQPPNLRLHRDGIRLRGPQIPVSASMIFRPIQLRRGLFCANNSPGI